LPKKKTPARVFWIWKTNSEATPKKKEAAQQQQETTNQQSPESRKTEAEKQKEIVPFEERRVGEGRRNLQSRKREAYNRKRVQGRKRMGGRIKTISISSSRR
jgi:hypothetical protein